MIEMIDLKRLATLVEQRRGGTSYRWAADEGGLPASLIYTAEKGQYEPTLSNFVRLARWLGIYPDELLRQILR